MFRNYISKNLPKHAKAGKAFVFLKVQFKQQF